MIKTNHEMQAAFDVDQTLILHGREIADQFAPGVIRVQDPYDDSIKYFQSHVPHVKLLKDYKTRGYHIIIWSANGGDWAEAIAKAIFGVELDKYVDECRTKLIKHVDDLPSDKILGERVWIDF